MRKIALVSAAVVATMAFAGVSSASALSWTPQNTKTTIKSGPDLQMVTAGGLTTNCSSPISNEWYGTASGASMKWTNAAGSAPTITCTGGLWGPNEKVSIQLLGNWSATATSTSAVTLNGAATAATVLQISFAELYQCDVKAQGKISSPGATWSNSTHVLTLNNTFTVEQMYSMPLCEALIGKHVTLKGTLIHESKVGILP
jgi:hypothetical protein